MLFENTVINDTYMIINEIGSGGMGVVYLAYHLRLEKYIVLKKIKNPYADISMLRNEVDILKSLHHPYLPQVYDFLEYGGDLYTVIDYIDGYDLNEYIKSGYVFTEGQLIKWLRQLCEVLQYLHSHQPRVLHTDIKPANIIITGSGDICLIDFGISLAQNDGIKGLSEFYSSPEQYMNFCYLQYGEGVYQQLDERTDIYSLGATYYHMMTGVRPDIKNAEQPPLSAYSLSYSDALVSIIDRSMQYDMNRRYKTAGDMLHAVDNIRKQDVRYKKYLLVQLVSSVIAAVMLVSGILLITNGFHQETTGAFEREYHGFLSLSNAGKTDAAAQTGMHILNQGSYEGLLDNSRRAELLQKIADCFFADEDYYNAAHYYSLALNYSRTEAVYRDYILSLIKDNRQEEAQRYTEELRAAYPSSTVLPVIQAQLSYISGNYQDAVNIVNQNQTALAADSENYYAAALIKGDAYSSVKAYDEAAQAYNEALSAKETLVALRKLGNAYLNASVKSGAAAGQQSAMNCLSAIMERYSPNTEDILNYSQLVLSLGEVSKYEECKRLLNEYSERKEDCRIYFLLAELADVTGDAAAEKYCEKAHELYKGLSDEEAYYISSDSLASVKRLYKKHCGREW